MLAEINKQVAEELRVSLALARGETPAPAPGPSLNQVPNASAVQGSIGASGVVISAPDTAASLVQQVEAPLPAQAPVPEPRPVSSARFTVEYLVLRMADELEVPARRARMPLLQLLRSIQESNLPLGVVMQELATWIEAANARAVSSLDRVQ